MDAIVSLKRCQPNLAVVNWRTVDVPKRSRNSMRRIAHALVLTILMLSSGCLGLLGDDDSESVVKESIPIELSMNGYNEFEFDQPAILSGSCN